MDNLKKIETLFHTTGSLENLLGIIEQNFTVSFSSEIFAGTRTQIPMVSFSNVLLFETKSQINYGDYSIGLTKEWGIKKNIHPVNYTYDDSDYEKSLQNLRSISEVGKLLDDFELIKNKVKLRLKSDQEFDEIFNQFVYNLDENGRKVVINFLELIHPIFLKNELLTKKIISKNKKGDQFECFNDREWRYLPCDVIDNFKYDLRSEKFSDRKEFEAAQKLNFAFIEEKKVHYSKEDQKLKFELEDLKFIIVKEKSEIKTIYDLLYKKFDLESVNERIQKGDLSILSFDTIFHNL